MTVQDIIWNYVSILVGFAKADGFYDEVETERFQESSITFQFQSSTCSIPLSTEIRYSLNHQQLSSVTIGFYTLS